MFPGRARTGRAGEGSTARRPPPRRRRSTPGRSRAAVGVSSGPSSRRPSRIARTTTTTTTNAEQPEDDHEVPGVGLHAAGAGGDGQDECPAVAVEVRPAGEEQHEERQQPHPRVPRLGELVRSAGLDDQGQDDRRARGRARRRPGAAPARGEQRRGEVDDDDAGDERRAVRRRARRAATSPARAAVRGATPARPPSSGCVRPRRRAVGATRSRGRAAPPGPCHRWGTTAALIAMAATTAGIRITIDVPTTSAARAPGRVDRGPLLTRPERSRHLGGRPSTVPASGRDRLRAGSVPDPGTDPAQEQIPPRWGCRPGSRRPTGGQRSATARR